MGSTRVKALVHNRACCNKALDTRFTWRVDLADSQGFLSPYVPKKNSSPI